MSLSEEPSTFEYTQNWLASSQAFVYDAMGATEPDLDASRDYAKARIYGEEALDEPIDSDEETSPDLPESIHPRPRAIVMVDSETRTRVGTGSWSSTGRLMIDVEVLVPDDYQINEADDDDATKASKFTARRQWARRLWTNLKNELEETSGQGDAQGNPYLNATSIDGTPPLDPMIEEATDWMGFTLQVNWIG